MVTTCLICKRQYDKAKEISFHTFPKSTNPARTTWKIACKLYKPLSKRARICSEHFTIDSFRKSYGIKLLKSSAIPSVFSWNREDNLTTNNNTNQTRIQDNVTSTFQQNQDRAQKLVSSSNELTIPCNNLRTLLTEDTAKDNLASSRTSLKRWHKAFKDKREDAEDEQPSERSSTSTTNKTVAAIKAVLDRDRRLDIRLVADEVGVSKMVAHQIVTENLNMSKICAKLVPKNLSDEQKETRQFISQELLDHVRTEPDFLRKVITGDKIWVFEYDTETKGQSSECTFRSPQSKKACRRERMKSMLIVFLDSQGIVHKEFVPTGQTVDQTFYLQVLERLRKKVLRVRPDMATTWVLHHSNSSHTSLAVSEFLAQKNIPVLPHPPHSPDLAPCDFFLSPKIKKHLKGHRFDTIENVQSAATRALNSLSHEDFLHCYEEWQLRWNRCVKSQGNYFEDNTKTSFYKDIEVKKECIDQLDEMNDEKKIIEDDSRTQGFKRGLEADKILGSADDNGELMYLMQWKGTDAVDIVSANEANTKCPQIVIQFYENRITWIK